MNSSFESISVLLSDVGLLEYVERFKEAEITAEDIPELTDFFLRKTLHIAEADHRDRILAGAIRGSARLSQASKIDYQRACKALAESKTWVTSVVETWPGPIAHEYQRLRELLQQGEIVSAVWQLKDVAEVLIRFPVCVMARDVFEYGVDLKFKATVRSKLFGPAMSMGGWLELAVMLSRHIHDHGENRFVCPMVARLFRKSAGKGKDTKLAEFLKEITGWRNRTLGHGAFRLELHEFSSELKSHVESLNANLFIACEQNIWHSSSLVAGDGLSLIGAESIRERHKDKHTLHQDERLLLSMKGKDGDLVLAPYLQLRRCNVCDSQDVFFFDWRRITEKEGRDRYGFIDYLAGHGVDAKWYQERDLHAEVSDLGMVDVALADDDLCLEDDVLDGDVVDMLAERLVTDRYKSPVYLRRALSNFLATHESGVWWLKAPGHVGKSTFVSGLDQVLRKQLGEGELGDDVRVAVFYIRREYQTWPSQMKEILGEQIKQVLNLRSGQKDLPELQVKSNDCAAAFGKWLSEWQLAAKGRFRLLVCIDGLDELPEPVKGQLTVADFLPGPENLSAGVYVAVTSRSDEDLPEWLLTKLRNRLSNANIHSVGLTDVGYRMLLRDYFMNRLANRQIATTHQTDSPLELEVLFEEACKKSGGRFTYLSYIADLLADETLPMEGVERLPPEEKMFEHFLTEIQRIHKGSKLSDYFERILLHLAIAEQAFELDREIQPAVVREETWNGLPLEILSLRVGERSGGKMTLRLAYALYTLKPVLDTWRGVGSGDTSYRLGLKGLNQVLQNHFGTQRLEEAHERLTDKFIDQFNTTDQDEIPLLDASDEVTFRYLAGHVKALGARVIPEADQVGCFFEYINFVGSKVTLSTKTTDSADVVRLASTAISILNPGDEMAVSALSSFYNFRSVALAALGDIERALGDASKSVDILVERIKRTSSVDAIEWENRLGEALTTRSTLYTYIDGAKDSCKKDVLRAIKLRENIRNHMRQEWPLRYRLSLAKSYINLGGIDRSIEPYERAIALLEETIDILRSATEQLVVLAGAYLCASGLSSGVNNSARLAGKAIAMFEAISNRSGCILSHEDEFIQSQAYFARSNFVNGHSKLSDLSCGIRILSDLYSRIGNEWPIHWSEKIASGYLQRAPILEKNSNALAAAEDYQAAIYHLQQYFKRLGGGAYKTSLFVEYARAQTQLALTIYRIIKSHGLKPELRIDLVVSSFKEAVKTYRRRLDGILLGDRLLATKDLTQAMMYLAKVLPESKSPDGVNEAIALLGEAVFLLEQQASMVVSGSASEVCEQLAQAYVDRGLLFGELRNVEDSIHDYSRAIDLRLAVQASGNRSIELGDSLAATYLNRAIALDNTGMHTNKLRALEDFNRVVDIYNQLQMTCGPASFRPYIQYLNEAIKMRDRLLQSLT